MSSTTACGMLLYDNIKPDHRVQAPSRTMAVGDSQYPPVAGYIPATKKSEAVIPPKFQIYNKDGKIECEQIHTISVEV